MAEVLSFIKRGWQNLWSRPAIFFFSGLTALTGLLSLVAPGRSYANLLTALFWLAAGTSALVLYGVGYLGVSYLAYCHAGGEATSISETLAAVKKFYVRFVGCSCLGLLGFSPFLCPLVGMYASNPARGPEMTARISGQAVALGLALSIFSLLVPYTLAGFFASDSGIWPSLRSAWSLFIRHFWVLAVLGLILFLMYRAYLTGTGLLAGVAQSLFSGGSLPQINYIDPYLSLSGNLLFRLLTLMGGVVYSAFSVSVMMLTYRKYAPEPHA